jgi:hypothetical protein
VEESWWEEGEVMGMKDRSLVYGNSQVELIHAYQKIKGNKSQCLTIHNKTNHENTRWVTLHS